MKGDAERFLSRALLNSNNDSGMVQAIAALAHVVDDGTDSLMNWISAVSGEVEMTRPQLAEIARGIGELREDLQNINVTLREISALVRARR